MVEPAPTGFDLVGKRILVTGASRGIGRACALVAARLGASVVLSARSEAPLLDAREPMPGVAHQVAPFDLGQIADIPAWVESLGPLHGLVHAAGIQSVAPLRSCSLSEVSRLMDLNVVSAIALAKGFRKRGVGVPTGSIVLIGSAMGLVGAPGRIAYSASKAAVIGATRSIALEVAREGHRANCVAPGIVKTDMWSDMLAALTEDQVRDIEGSHPLGLGEPTDVANLVAFLLSDASRWITGACIAIDGGYTAQ